MHLYGTWMLVRLFIINFSASSNPFAGSSPTSTLWGACEGSCLHYEHEGGNFYQYGAAREVDMTPILNVGGALSVCFAEI